MRRIWVAMLSVFLVSCTQMAAKPPAAKVEDGELALPADYKSWPKFLSEIQRPDAKQVRDIYVNPRGHAAEQGRPFPHGTVFVMENYKATEAADGTLMKGDDGRLVKGELTRVFVMGKGEAWGDAAPEGLRNGDWTYASYDPSGKKTADSFAACRACHMPLEKKDFVYRYDEYFRKRAQGGSGN
jgi:hypothetical protein